MSTTESALIGGDGDVAARLREVDWAATSLGPPQTWPRPLAVALQILLTSRFSMWMAWGPELTFFCNDAYRRDTLGEKYPWALGRPAAEVWSEIWSDVWPRIDGVLRTGQATWDESLLLFLQRSGYVEETYHTFSYSPLRDEDDRVAGMMCVVTEETDRVIGERRLQLLSRLSAATPQAWDEPRLLGHLEAQLAAELQSFPFSLVYLFEPADPGAPARLACTAGIPAGHPAAPETFGPDGPWGAGAWQDGASVTVLDDLSTRFGAGLPGGAWDDPPARAVVSLLPGAERDRPLGLLVSALAPYRPVDPELLAFVDLVAGQITAQVAAVRAYAAERQRAERLAELDRAKTTFFTNVSHEFRTPLTLMLGPAEDALADPGTLPAEQQARLEVIHRNAQRLLKLVNTLLDFSRLEAGRTTARFRPVDLGRYTGELASMFRSAVDRAGLSLVVDCPPAPEPVYVDPEMWAKVVLNLLSNALKFTVDGGITVRLRPLDDAVELSVQDTGIGIAAQEQPRLFERFHRTTSAWARTHEGSGIGLALVAELAALHGGRVDVRSEPGRGSRFTVTVPLGTAHLPAGQLVDLDTEPPQPYADVVERQAQGFLAEADRWLQDEETADDQDGAVRGRRQVLVVDDNADMRRYVVSLLEDEFRVRTAPHGAAALSLALTEPPDLVLTDAMMPFLDGFGLLAALRQDPRTAAVPVIMLSARAGEEAAVEGLRAGADDYLAKPFSAQELRARVKANLELAELRSEDSTWRRVLVDSIQDAFLILTADGTVLEVNEAFRELVGHPVPTPLPTPHPWADQPTDEPSRARLAEEVARVLATGHGSVRVPLRHSGGNRIWAEAMVTSLVDPRTGEQVFVSTLRDITAAVLAAEQQEALTRLSGRLAEASSVDQVLTVALQELQRIRGADRGVVALVGDDGSLSRVIGSDGPPTPVASRALRDAAAGDRVLVRQDRGTGLGLACRAEGLVAAFWLEHDRPTPVTEADRDGLARLADPVSHALARADGYDRQRAVALTLQRSILGPVDLPAGFAVRYQPAERPLEVGGDWYDVVRLAGRLVGVVVGDCVGKGLPAAAVMGQLRSACRALLLQAKSPAEALVALDDFAMLIPDAACTTVFCAIIDQSTGLVRYSAAGHPPAVLAHADGSTELLDQARSVPLASVRARHRPEATAQLRRGSALMLYTDGLVERRREHFDTGLDRAVDTLRAGLAGPARDEDELAEQLLHDVLRGEQQDDVALLVYRHRNPPPLVLAVPAEPARLASVRRTLRSWLLAAGAGETEADAVLIASGEACANAIEHGYRFAGGQTLHLSATLVGGTLELEVRDHGGWRPPRHTPGRGRGRGLMERLMDGTRIEPGPDGTVVRMWKDLGHAG